MVLSVKERQDLVARVVDLHPSLNELDFFLEYHLNRRLSEITLDGPLQQRALRVIGAAEARGWLPAFLMALEQVSPHSLTARLLVRVEESVESIRRQQAPWHAPFPRQRLFVDRVGLRDHVRALVAGDVERVLVVDGPRFSGKTYSKHLIRHVREACDTFDVVEFDFASYADPTLLTPEQIVRELGNHMGCDTRELDRQLDVYAQSARQIGTLTSWLSGRIKSGGRKWWWVFDGLEIVRPSDGVLDLLKRFMDLADCEPKLCVVLLGYDADLQLVDGAGTLQETLKDLGALDVEDFIRAIAEEANLTLPGMVISSLVQDILDGLPTEREKRGHELTLRLGRTVASLRRVT